MIISTCSVMPPGMAVSRSTPKGLVGGRPDRRHLGHHRLVAHGRGTEAPEPSGLRDGGDELGVGDAAHAGQHDGVLDPEQLGESCAHRRGPSCSRSAVVVVLLSLPVLVASLSRPTGAPRRCGIARRFPPVPAGSPAPCAGPSRGSTRGRRAGATRRVPPSIGAPDWRPPEGVRADRPAGPLMVRGEQRSMGVVRGRRR